jgi:hypothetical protein
MRKATITLTTDFGLGDHFVGVMKGVIRTIAPHADIVDISHELHAFDVTEAAFVVGETYRWWPKRTIHVVVIDPGVGTSRRPILIEAAGQYFLAPDNGVLTLVARRENCKVRAITKPRFFLTPVSNTFHGRDVFAPCAAHLAAGVRPPQFGRLIHDPLRLAIPEPVRTGKRVWTGAIRKIDRFGNMITNFRVADFEAVRLRPFDIAVGLERISKLARSYAEGEADELFLIAGSSGYFEICCNMSSAARRTGCASGAPVELTLW